MTAARIHLDAKLPAAEALARSQALLAAVDRERPVLLYGAELSDAAVVLGAYQHAPHALQSSALSQLALPVLRRRTGGAAVFGGEGVLYFALGLADASALMQCPPGRILNRNVRGFLAGIRALRVPAHYFGRDFVSFDAQPGAYLGWDEADDGRVLVEFFIGLETAFTLPEGMRAQPAGAEPPLRGKTPITLRGAGDETHSAAEVLEQVAQGHGKSFGLELAQTPPSAAELASAAALRAALAVDVADTAGLAWSDPLPEAIGGVSAGARLDAGGAFAAVRVAGDFYQHRACAPQLRAHLLGAAPDPDRIGAALDAVYAARPGLIEGVRSLNTLRSALLQAAERAGARA